MFEVLGQLKEVVRQAAETRVPGIRAWLAPAGWRRAGTGSVLHTQSGDSMAVGGTCSSETSGNYSKPGFAACSIMQHRTGHYTSFKTNTAALQSTPCAGPDEIP